MPAPFIPIAFMFPPVTAIAAGADHTCASTASGLFCWGRYTIDQVAVVATPVALAAPPSTMMMNGGTSCVTTSEGTAYCWGTVGIFDYSVAPEEVAGASDILAMAVSTNRLCASRTGGVSCWFYAVGDGEEYPALAEITQLGAGERHHCGLLHSDVVCWGNGQYGQLGHASSIVGPAPVEWMH